MAVLAIRDLMGYNMEFEDKNRFEQAGLSKFLVYCNPANPWAWKRKKQKGVDKIFQIGKHTFYVEESYCNRYYTYRTTWFQKCRLARFQGLPTDKFSHYIILTNRPENFEAVLPLANNYTITITDIQGLLSLFNHYISNTNLNNDNNNSNIINNVYAYSEELPVKEEYLRIIEEFCRDFNRTSDCAKHGVPWAVRELEKYSIDA